MGTKQFKLAVTLEEQDEGGSMTLFEEFPRPWKIIQDESVDPDKFIGGFRVLDVNGKTVIDGGTYTGDGDSEFNLNRLQVAQLVAIVNVHGLVNQ